jgi:dynactin 1
MYTSRAMTLCIPDVLRRLAHVYHDLVTHERTLDFLIDLLQKDRLHNSIALNVLDKTILFYEVILLSSTL